MGIHVKNVSKRFRSGTEDKEGFLAVDNVSFTVPEGHLVALLGPSGSGKSTILRIIAGLEVPDTGEVYLKKEAVTHRPAQKRGIGFVFQHYALFKHMTVRKNISFGLEVRKWPRKEIQKRVDELLDLVQLQGYDNRYPSQLSGGQRQRVALARALAPRPAVLLLDEPFGSLDAKVRRNLSSQLRRLHDEVHTTTVFVTHDQEEAIEIADKIVVINRGRVEQIGTAEEVYDRPKTKFVASFIGNVNVIEGITLQGNIYIGPNRTVIPGLTAPESWSDVVLLVRPENVRIVPGSVADGIKGTILDIRYMGAQYEIDLDIGGLGVRMVEEKVRGQALGLQAGRPVSVRFTRHSVFEAEEGHAALRAKLQSLGYIE